MGVLLLVFLGSGLGGVARYLVSEWLTPTEWARPGPPFPFGTLAVNLGGCLLIGLVGAWCARRDWARGFFVIGVLGGFTTFSTFGIDTVRMLASGHVGRAVLYVTVSVLAGIAGAWITFRHLAPPIN